MKPSALFLTVLVAFLGIGCQTSSVSRQESTEPDSVQEPPQIATLTAEPLSDIVVGDTVTFIARLTAPGEGTWNFGDGATGTGLEAKHVYAAEGRYTVTFHAEGGTAASLIIEVWYPYPDYCSEITELNLVFFGRNSSRLDQASTVDLAAENRELLLDCPRLRVRLDGVARSRERQPRRLATERAEAVRQFYLEAGIQPEQVEVGAPTVAERGQGMPGEWMRRVDTVVLE